MGIEEEQSEKDEEEQEMTAEKAQKAYIGSFYLKAANFIKVMEKNFRRR